jgi:hypothetical protein
MKEEEAAEAVVVFMVERECIGMWIYGVVIWGRRAKVGGMTVMEIKEEIARLTAEERAEIARELADEAWSAQMRADAAAGRLDFLFDEADAERREGLLKTWPRA